MCSALPAIEHTRRMAAKKKEKKSGTEMIEGGVVME